MSYGGQVAGQPALRSFSEVVAMRASQNTYYKNCNGISHPQDEAKKKELFFPLFQALSPGSAGKK